MKLINIILNIFFPVNCLSCGKYGEELCFTCISNFPMAEKECEKWIFPIFDYQHNIVKNAIWHLKYKGKMGLAKIFAKILYERMIEELTDLSILENFCDSILVPVPLTPKRKRERGFNQAELICKELIKLDGKNHTFGLEKNVLLKIKDTKHQAQIENRSERLENIVGSFAIKNPNKIKGGNIILIDDVTTTGATLSEAKKVLRQSGAKKVIAFTFAH